MFTEELNQYIIPGALPFINKWCKGYGLQLAIKNARHTKLGDYKLINGRHHITLNYGLHKALTFHILTHEIAHMHAVDKYGLHIKPHGKEWKNVFRGLILESIHLYEEDLQPILLDFAKNPRAGYFAFQPLAAYFHKKDNPNTKLLKDLPHGTIFRIKQKVFKKGNKRKIRYICRDINSGREYAVHGLAPIDEIIEDISL